MLAQEVTSEAQPLQIESVETTSMPSEGQPSEPSINFDLGETIPIIGGIAILIILCGTFYILNLAINALSVSVPQDVIHKIGESLVNNMNETMKVLSDKAALTPSPVDDIIVDIGELTLDAVKQKFLPQLSVEDLISEIQKRNADTPDTSPVVNEGI